MRQIIFVIGVFDTTTHLILGLLFVKVPRQGDSEGTFASSCHLLLPI